MNNFFASLYEWFGLGPFYSTDLGEHLRGWDITCSDYVGTPWYAYIGVMMIVITLFVYAFQYHIFNSSSFNKRGHWWLMAMTIFGLNFFIAFIVTYNDFQSGNFCNQLRISTFDCVGFGFSTAIWSLILFFLITSFPYPRKWSGYNMTDTTFWKPRS